MWEISQLFTLHPIFWVLLTELLSTPQMVDRRMSPRRGYRVMNWRVVQRSL
jgi:hypothetical protein